MELCEKFYDRVFSDHAEPWFQNMFIHRNKEDLTQDFFDHLYQRLGGSNYYTERKGLPNIHLKHEHIRIDRRAAQRWLKHMQDTLEELEESIGTDYSNVLLNYFKYFAYYLVISQEISSEDDVIESLRL